MTEKKFVKTNEKTHLFKLPLSLLPMGEVIERIDQWIQEKKPRSIVTVDAACAYMAWNDIHHLNLINQFDLATIDGAGVCWALKKRCGITPEKVSGIDLADRLVERSSKKGYRIFLLGAKPGIAELAAKNLEQKYPGCEIVGIRDGYFSTDEDEEVAKSIAEHDPHILLVALGMPRQENFIHNAALKYCKTVAIGVGGSFDVFSGQKKRAPRWMRNAGLEWMWRLLNDFSKFKKVMLLPLFVIKVLSSKNENLH